MAEAKRYWKNSLEMVWDPVFLSESQNEFPETAQDAPSGWTRRELLRAVGFTFAAAMLPGCQRTPVRHAVPYLVAPDGVTPGQPLWYASTCGGCCAACGLLVKNLDGRPIKLEGNPEHPLSQGGLCAAGQASVLGLYDRQRLQSPLNDGERKNWNEVDAAVRRELNDIRESGGKVRFLSGTITSPTTRNAVNQFLAQFRDGKHVVYDPVSYSAILDAHQRTHGVRALPSYELDRADIIVSFDADFLGTWISPVEFARAWSTRRRPTDDPASMSKHVHLESRLSLTGSKADKRICVAPGKLGVMLSYLASRVAAEANVTFPNSDLDDSEVPWAEYLDALARELWNKRERSLVLCGSQDFKQQKLCNFLNQVLDNYGATVDLQHISYQSQGNDSELESLIEEIREGQVQALFVYKCNPLFDLPHKNLTRNLEQIPLTVTFAERLDETARVAKYVCPDHHYLETWSDAEPVNGVVSLGQPAIEPLGGSRSILESLATWSGRTKSAYDQVWEYWQAHIFPRQSRYSSFHDFWNHTLHNGVAEVRSTAVNVNPSSDWQSVIEPIVNVDAPADDAFSLVLYTKVGMPDGSHAYNPWLQELPDPVTKVTWDNYACLSHAAAERLGVSDGDVVRLAAGDGDPHLDLPVYVQPGQHDSVVAVALGYGSVLSERFRNLGPQWLDQQLAGATCVGENGKVGTNAAPLNNWQDNFRSLSPGSVRVTKQNKWHPLACTQTHHSINVPPGLAPEGQRRRPVVQETTLHALQHGHTDEHHDEGHHEHADLWPEDHPIEGHHWGMAIDLTACSGCSACVIACQVENNIPVVGKDEVRRQREMHWIRIDRYFAGEGTEVDVAHQPMLCHHCDNAPCETVCPVLATVHSQEGLNQQVYNRCVGTRYCANNCPYKVRRFNWFHYSRDDERENLVLNPDVTVRSRGVMEKCTFCVQRIQEAKIDARSRGVALREEDLRTACQQSCPANAIIFGDLNDPQSRVAQLRSDPRHYQVLAELNVRPSVSYLKLVRNRETEGEHGD